MDARALNRIRILELMTKFKALERQTKLEHEIFFAVNLNRFKKYQRKERS